MQGTATAAGVAAVAGLTGLGTDAVSTVTSRAAAALPTPPAGTVRRTLPSGRTFILRRRQDPTPGPAIVGLHATAHDALHAEQTFWVVPNHPEQSGWSKHAALRDYTLVLGEGLDGRWNVGNGWPGGTQDDEAYLLDVAAELAALDNVDPARTFAAGFSAGAAMAWTMAARHPDAYAACAMFSGWASYYPTTPIDCYHMHGTADATVPLLGGAGVYDYVFPNISLETLHALRASMFIYNLTVGGHATPGWAAQRVYDFFVHDRLR